MLRQLLSVLSQVRAVGKEVLLLGKEVILLTGVTLCLCMEALLELSLKLGSLVRYLFRLIWSRPALPSTVPVYQDDLESVTVVVARSQSFQVTLTGIHKESLRVTGTPKDSERILHLEVDTAHVETFDTSYPLSDAPEEKDLDQK